MDILHLVDRLEELFNDSRPIPLTHSVIINEDRILDIIDQMRVTIPDEMKKAQQVLTQRDRVLAQSQEEANRTLALAREKSEKMIERDALAQAAKVQADEIISKVSEYNVYFAGSIRAILRNIIQPIIKITDLKTGEDISVRRRVVRHPVGFAVVFNARIVGFIRTHFSFSK